MVAPVTLGRTPSLRKVKFGSMMVTELCAGSMTWGSFNGIEAEAHAQLDRLVALGVNFFDTAEMYPVAFNYGETTERWIGNWLAARRAEVPRASVFIATKCNCNGKGSPQDGVQHAYTADRVMASCKASLARLQCDYLDLYMLHYPSRVGHGTFGWGSWGTAERHCATKISEGDTADFERQVLAVKALLDAGLVRDWGLSNENAYGLTMFCVTCDRLGVRRPISCQNDFSLNNRTYENDMAEACHHFGVVGMPYGALAGGVLTGKYAHAEFAGDRPLAAARMNAHPEFQPRYLAPMGALAAKEYVTLAKEWGLTPAELALAWARDRPYNAVVVTGTTTLGQVEACVEALKLEPLPKQLNDAVDAIHEKYRSPNAALASKQLVLDAPWLNQAA